MIHSPITLSTCCDYEASETVGNLREKITQFREKIGEPRSRKISHKATKRDITIITYAHINKKVN